MERRQESSMIRLENIREKDDIVKCDFYPENSKNAGTLNFSRKNNNVEVCYPKGYEYCTNHVNRALRFLKSNFDLPARHTIMWY